MPRRTCLRYTHGHAAFVLIPLFSSLGASVSLSDFNPKLSGLPSQCQSVYTQSISGCSTSDFTNGSPCSEACASALQALSSEVKQACATLQLPGGDIISAFLSGSGVNELCPNVNSQSSGSNGGATGTVNTANGPGFVSTVSFTSFLAPSATSSSSISTSSSSATSSSSSDTTTSSSSLTTSMSAISTTLMSLGSTAPLLTASMSSLTVDTSSAPAMNPSQSSSLESMVSSLTSSAPPIRTSDSSDRSGGGSPFDISTAHLSAKSWSAVTVVASTMLVGALLTQF